MFKPFQEKLIGHSARFVIHYDIWGTGGSIPLMVCPTINFKWFHHALTFGNHHWWDKVPPALMQHTIFVLSPICKVTDLFFAFLPMHFVRFLHCSYTGFVHAKHSCSIESVHVNQCLKFIVALVHYSLYWSLWLYQQMLPRLAEERLLCNVSWNHYQCILAAFFLLLNGCIKRLASVSL